MAGFAGALALGADTLEMDVAMTRDDVVVVSHDPALHPAITRTPDGAWIARPGPSIRSLQVAELAGYDVGRILTGSTYAAAFPDQVPCDGERIPLLEHVLRIDARARFNIELKTFPLQPGLTVDGQTMADAVAAVVDATETVARITVQSFDWRGPRHLRRTRPDIRLAWLTRAAILPQARAWWEGPHPADYGGSVPRAVAAEGGPIWAPEHVDLTQASVAEAHGLGLRVIPWTVNRPDEMRRLIGWGIDGLITDRPDLAHAVMAA